MSSSILPVFYWNLWLTRQRLKILWNSAKLTASLLVDISIFIGPLYYNLFTYRSFPPTQLWAHWRPGLCLVYHRIPSVFYRLCHMRGIQKKMLNIGMYTGKTLRCQQEHSFQSPFLTLKNTALIISGYASSGKTALMIAL